MYLLDVSKCNTDLSLNITQLTHCTAVKFKSKGDVVVSCLRLNEDLLHVFSVKVVSHNCVRVAVPLKQLKE